MSWLITTATVMVTGFRSGTSKDGQRKYLALRTSAYVRGSGDDQEWIHPTIYLENEKTIEYLRTQHGDFTERPKLMITGFLSAELYEGGERGTEIQYTFYHPRSVATVAYGSPRRRSEGDGAPDDGAPPWDPAEGGDEGREQQPPPLPQFD